MSGARTDRVPIVFFHRPAGVHIERAEFLKTYLSYSAVEKCMALFNCVCVAGFVVVKRVVQIKQDAFG